MNIPESEFPVSGYLAHGLAWVLPCFALTGPSTEGLCLESSGSVGTLSRWIGCVEDSESIQSIPAECAAVHNIWTSKCVVDMTWYAYMHNCNLHLPEIVSPGFDLQICKSHWNSSQRRFGRVPGTLKLNHLPETTFRLCITITGPPKRRRNVIHHRSRFGFDQLLSFWSCYVSFIHHVAPSFLEV